jgi:hypothetical protein
MGNGYNAMSESLFNGYGDDVKHTHNDTLDMLLVAGLLGASWLLTMLIYWARQIVRISFWSLEGAAAGAILLNYLCHSQLTGQLWGTDAMSYYIIALSAFSVLGRKAVEARPRIYQTGFELVTAR